MLASDLVEVMRSVAVTDPATCDAAGLATLADEAHRLRCWLDSIDAALVARRRELASAGGRRSSREADVVSERATVCEAMPEVHAAMAAGTLSAGHADAIARACNRLDDDERVELAAMAPELVTQAASTSVDAFARKVRDLARRISTMRVSGTTRSCGHSGRCAVGGTAKACATPRSASTPKPTPGSRPCSTPQSPPNEPSRMITGRSTSSAPTPSSTSSPPRRHQEHGDRPSSSSSATCGPCRTASTTPASARRSTANPSHPRWSADWPATRTSSRSCWTATAASSTSAEPNASPPPINDEHSAPCTAPAQHPTALFASATATSTTSRNGKKAARRTSRT